ncbi:hypothetical protein L210DRAFT_3643925 [Boletus edulis BED1]|uniref:T6SS Phospholipase effector Tle1-like catalytic domain-containing protein n=1 Tax=Boletus edulis BED1 TaxID=1328754 RepID=A0AAD4BYC0_BOLED|nr:hypothetical protein L210DRAFT_3643925 [Boletus edulis BED1]
MSDASKDFSRPLRTIVLCFDGTNGQYDLMNTNVVKFFGLLNKDCTDQQVAYYQAGVGTYFAPGVVSPLWLWFASLMDEAVAWYLDEHVMAGYKFLMDNYHAGDKICLFGFSRGAYTARALAGMLNRVGLLPKDNLQQVNFAYKAYTRSDKEGVELAAGFKKTFSQDVKVEFVGVWDTVQSTGMLINRILPFTNSNSAVKVFRHALSLDEHRSKFRPNLYHWPTKDDGANEVVDMEGPVKRTFDILKSNLKQLFKREYAKVQPQQTVKFGPSTDGAQRNQRGDELALDETQLETEFVAEESWTTDVLEVWFAGCHSDIGGGNVEDDVQVSLAQITLHWMVEQVVRSECGILFDSDELARIGFTPPVPAPNSSPNSDNNLPRDAPEECTWGIKDSSALQESPNEPNQHTPSPDCYPERSDAIAPLFDELKISKMWWILEVLPFSYAWQDHNGDWHSKWSINWGRGRFIPYRQPKFHYTVKERVDYKPLDYKPRAIYDHNEVYV